jgi:predicted dehydrogenase
MTDPVRLAVIGAGAIGRRHIEQIVADPLAAFAGVADPTPEAKAIAESHGVRWFPGVTDLLAAADKPDGVIIATPNHLHVPNGLEAVAAGIPVLVEKPVSNDLAEATRLVEAAESAGVPLLVGHHRRHNPLLQAAKRALDGGRVGKVLAAHAMCWFFKPDAYFDIAWRREKGAGPVFLNLIHDVDSLRYLCGEVVSVQALEASTVRGNPVEETAAVLLRFASGALGTLSVSDSIVAPWNWELTSGENPVYPHTDEFCCQIGGTHGALAIPSLDLWGYPGERSWIEPVTVGKVGYRSADPLTLQIEQFRKVIRGEEPPLVSGREGLETLRVIDAVKRSAATGEMVRLGKES